VFRQLPRTPVPRDALSEALSAFFRYCTYSIVPLPGMDRFKTSMLRVGSLASANQETEQAFEGTCFVCCALVRHHFKHALLLLLCGCALPVEQS
jgi:hypothetical protein